MSWYRTHRPQTISGLHLTTVRDHFLRMLKADTIPHALLLAGPKGTGKTSSARIIAKVLNCEKAKKGLEEPCNECELCLNITKGTSVNVIEIDAASNRRIDDIRELKERIYMPPAVGKKLVFIIDEVHMLTNEAFNALLKILEEPPEHAVFMLATTDVHKLPDTVVSRCTIVQFQKASVPEISNALEGISKKEKVDIEKPVLEIIATRADGSFRDAVKLLQEIAEAHTGSKITLDVVQKIFPTLQQLSPVQLIQAILAKQETQVVSFFQTAQDRDANAIQLHKDILQFLHGELLKSLKITAGESIAPLAVVQFLLKQFSLSIVDERLPLPLLPLELCALEMVLKSKAQAGGGGSMQVGKVAGVPGVGKSENHKVVPSGSENRKMGESGEQNTVNNQMLDVVGQLSNVTDQMSNVAVSPFKADSVVKDNTKVAEVATSSFELSGDWANGALLQDKWEDLLKTVGVKNLSIEALLRSSKFVTGEQGKVQIQVFYQFHKQQLELERYQRVVQECIRGLIGGDVKLEYIFNTQEVAVLGSADANVTGGVSQEVSDLINLAEEALL